MEFSKPETESKAHMMSKIVRRSSMGGAFIAALVIVKALVETGNEIDVSGSIFDFLGSVLLLSLFPCLQAVQFAPTFFTSKQIKSPALLGILLLVNLTVVGIWILAGLLDTSGSPMFFSAAPFFFLIVSGVIVILVKFVDVILEKRKAS